MAEQAEFGTVECLAKPPCNDGQPIALTEAQWHSQVHSGEVKMNWVCPRCGGVALRIDLPAECTLLSYVAVSI